MANEIDPFLSYPFAQQLIDETSEDWIKTSVLGMDDQVLGHFQDDTRLAGSEILAMKYLASLRIKEKLYD